MIIAIDFDGTIVEHQYPLIGKPLPNVFFVLRELQEEGYRLVLWTYRTGKELEEAIRFCSANGVEFFAVNKSYPEELFESTSAASRKINADLFIDDRNIGGLPPWKEIYKTISGKELGKDVPRGSFLTSLFKK